MRTTLVDRYSGIALCSARLRPCPVAGQTPAVRDPRPPPPPLIRGERATVQLLPITCGPFPISTSAWSQTSASSSAAKATLVVDTGLGPRNGEAHRPRDEEGEPQRGLFVVTTHYHPGALAWSRRLRRREAGHDPHAAAGHDRAGKSIQDTFASRSALNKELLSGVPVPHAGHAVRS
jgi:hypothetical protein